MSDERLFFPATERNRQVILDVIGPAFRDASTVLEVASGSGEHAMFFARHLPQLMFQPTDREPEHLRSIDAWRAHTRLSNVKPALALDVTAEWPRLAADAVFCANMIHIAPFAATEGLLRGVGALLAPGCPLALYGPFRVGGVHTAPSNERFDASLRQRNPEWGVRDLDRVTALADEAGLTLEQRISMPANNFTILFRRR